jgi:hypothetical protein
MRRSAPRIKTARAAATLTALFVCEARGTGETRAKYRPISAQISIALQLKCISEQIKLREKRKTTSGENVHALKKMRWKKAKNNAVFILLLI